MKLNQNQINEVAKGIKEGKKLVAIKAINMYTGLGLRESKDYIEQFYSSKYRIGNINNNKPTQQELNTFSKKFTKATRCFEFENTYVHLSDNLSNTMKKLIQDHGLRQVMKTLSEII